MAKIIPATCGECLQEVSRNMIKQGNTYTKGLWEKYKPCPYANAEFRLGTLRLFVDKNHIGEPFCKWEYEDKDKE